MLFGGSMFFREMMDEKSSISNMRFMALIALLNGLGLLWYGAIESKNTDIAGMGLVSVAIGGKILQKNIEVKNVGSDSSNSK